MVGKTNKILILLLFLLLINAWNWETHQNIIERIYYGLDTEIQDKLILESLEQGAITPDSVFRDYRKHHYPDSYELALKWLNTAKNSFDNQDYNMSSYALGVASHYISDSFSDPHYINKESGSLHSSYEDHDDYKIKTGCKNYNLDLKETLSETSKDNHWNKWVKTKDDKIPQSRIERSTKLMFSITLNLFNTKCNEFVTKVENQKLNFFNNSVKIFAAFVVVGLIIFRKSIF